MNRNHMTRDAKNAAKLEKKLKVLLGKPYYCVIPLCYVDKLKLTRTRGTKTNKMMKKTKMSRSRWRGKGEQMMQRNFAMFLFVA